MDGSRSSRYVLILMKNLNFLILLYLSTVMAHSISGHIQENTALDFLAQVGTLPLAGWKLPVMALGLYVCCLMLLQVQSVNGPQLAVKVAAELVLSFCISFVTDVRRSINALRPDVLEKMDLEKALTQMMDEMRSSTNVEIVYTCTTGLGGFNEDEENVIYRIIQESITNAIRHGMADKICVNISRKYDTLDICVSDNGKGCGEIKKGFGLHHMEERLSMLQGSLSYRGDNGFIVDAHIPIRWGTEEKEDDKDIDCG